MLKINLLPEEQRKTSLSPVEQFHRTPLMLMILLGLFLLPLMVWLPIALRQGQLKALNAKIQALDPKKQEVDQLQRFLQSLQAQEIAFQGLTKGQGVWAKRLNTLSDVTPEGVWFTTLTLDPSKGLVIHGSAVGQMDPGMVNVTRLVHSLKADSDFMAAVKDIQIESIKRVQEGEVEVMQFTLNCPLLETQAS